MEPCDGRRSWDGGRARGAGSRARARPEPSNHRGRASGDDRAGRGRARRARDGGAQPRFVHSACTAVAKARAAARKPLFAPFAGCGTTVAPGCAVPDYTTSGFACAHLWRRCSSASASPDARTTAPTSARATTARQATAAAAAAAVRRTRRPDRRRRRQEAAAERVVGAGRFPSRARCCWSVRRSRSLRCCAVVASPRSRARADRRTPHTAPRGNAWRQEPLAVAASAARCPTAHRDADGASRRAATDA